MFTYIDRILDRITMYKVILYYLIGIILYILGLSLFKYVSYTPLSILESIGVILIISLITNTLFSKVYKAPTNQESVYITALILVCILPPIQSIHDLPLLVWAAILAVASKYILAIHNKHIFNPAAIAVVLTALWLNQSAIWWISTSLTTPIIIIGGLLMVRKLRRYDMVYSFFVTAIITNATFNIMNNQDIIQGVQNILLRSPLLFFGFVMFTEPLTSPATNTLQILFGIIVGILFAPQLHLGNLYFTPELALVSGNIFSYLVSPKIKERLTLNKKNNLNSNIIEFDFKPTHKFAFIPGQYMEFTFPHSPVDSRGNRRYFTIASSPTEETVKLGIKFYPNSSTFKKNLATLSSGQTIMAGQLAGDFILPKDPLQKVVFIAGGIGITPFRSILKYLIDINHARPTTLLYMNKTIADVVYTELLNEAQEKIKTKIVYTLTDSIPNGWQGRSGQINEKMIREEVPDFKERIFYISGPSSMVSSIEKTLEILSIKQNKIKKDFFPGLA